MDMINIANNDNNSNNDNDNNNNDNNNDYNNNDNNNNNNDNNNSNNNGNDDNNYNNNNNNDNYNNNNDLYFKRVTQSNNTLVFPVALSVQHHYGTPTLGSRLKNSFRYCSYKYSVLKD